ncbi:unnamed protein product [Ectocarpus sp. 12 AP-2014]
MHTTTSTFPSVLENTELDNSHHSPGTARQRPLKINTSSPAAAPREVPWRRPAVQGQRLLVPPHCCSALPACSLCYEPIPERAQFFAAAVATAAGQGVLSPRAVPRTRVELAAAALLPTSTADTRFEAAHEVGAVVADGPASAPPQQRALAQCRPHCWMPERARATAYPPRARSRLLLPSRPPGHLRRSEAGRSRPARRKTGLRLPRRRAATGRRPA